MKLIFQVVIAVSIIAFGAYFYSSGNELTEPGSNPLSEKVNTNAVDSSTKTAEFLGSTTEDTSLSKEETNEHDYANDQAGSYSGKTFEELEERYNAILENDRYPTLLSRLSAIEKRRPGANYSAAEVLAAIEKPFAWETTDEPGSKLNKLSEEELSDGRQFVNFDPLKVETLMQGDHMEVPVDSVGRVFDMRIDSVRVFGDGNIMWKGPITNVDGGGLVTITQSKKISVASVVLAEDDFTLQSHGGDGWIVDSGTLFKIDPDVVDFIIPE